MENLGSSVLFLNGIPEDVKNLAWELSRRHMDMFDNGWVYGEIKDVWIDCNGNICIRYESGDWWHYSESGEWW